MAKTKGARMVTKIWYLNFGIKIIFIGFKEGFFFIFGLFLWRTYLMILQTGVSRGHLYYETLKNHQIKLTFSKNLSLFQLYIKTPIPT